MNRLCLGASFRVGPSSMAWTSLPVHLCSAQTGLDWTTSQAMADYSIRPKGGQRKLSR